MCVWYACVVVVAVTIDQTGLCNLNSPRRIVVIIHRRSNGGGLPSVAMEVAYPPSRWRWLTIRSNGGGLPSVAMEVAYLRRVSTSFCPFVKHAILIYCFIKAATKVSPKY